MRASGRQLWLTVMLGTLVGLLPAAAGAQQSGTMLGQTLTLIKGTANASMDFTIAANKSTNTTTRIILEIGPDGNAPPPPPPDPNLPSTVRFRVTKTGVANPTDFTTAGGAEAANFPNKIVALSKGLETPDDPRGLYVLSITHLDPGTTAAESWRLELQNLPTGLRAIAAIDQGTFTNLSPTGPVAQSCPSGQTCKGPCPNICPGGTSCRGPCPSCCPTGDCCPHIDWWKYTERIVDIKWPVPPSPCLSCPPIPWETPIPAGFERVIVFVTPYVKEGQRLGPGRGGDIKLNVQDGEVLGAPFEAGGGRYAYLIQYRAGASPRVSATVGRTTTDEVVAAPQAAGARTLRRTVYVLAVLLALALAMIIYLALRGRRGIARG